MSYIKICFFVFACTAFIVSATESDSFKQCRCAKDFQPICGSDGKTYPNICVLRCEQQTINDRLTALYSGAC